MEKPEVFRSKVDAWLLLALFGVPTALIAVTAVVGADNPQLIVMVLLFSLIPEGFAVWLLIATHYTVDGTTLRIRSGPFRWDVDIPALPPSNQHEIPCRARHYLSIVSKSAMATGEPS